MKVGLNEVKVSKPKKFNQLFQKRRHYDVNGQKKYGGDNPSRKLQTMLSSEHRYIDTNYVYLSEGRKHVF